MNQWAISDCELAAQFRRGHQPAFEQLVQRYKARVFTSIYFMVKDTYLAEDILQENFATFIEKVQSAQYAEVGLIHPGVTGLTYRSVAIESLISKPVEHFSSVLEKRFHLCFNSTSLPSSSRGNSL